MSDGLSRNISSNIRQLREIRGLTQSALASLSKVPRPTVSNLESASSNPTIAVLVRIAEALQVSVESLLYPPRSTTRFYPAASIPVRRRGAVTLRPVLPDRLGSIEMDRMELQARGRMGGLPHKTGTREYLTCESGSIELTVAGQTWHLKPGDVVVFRGDQRHSYFNPNTTVSVGYSTILVGVTLQS